MTSEDKSRNISAVTLSDIERIVKEAIQPLECSMTYLNDCYGIVNECIIDESIVNDCIIDQKFGKECIINESFVNQCMIDKSIVNDCIIDQKFGKKTK
jgi:hypothetical protein